MAIDDHNNNEVSCEDVQIITSSKQRISADSSLLASASPVLERILEFEKEKQRRKGKSKTVTAPKIRIPGVPHDAVVAFVRSLQSMSMKEEDVERYGIHLLALSHVYQVTWLKNQCEVTLSALLTTETILDMLQLARLCDAQRLHLRCLKFVVKDFSAVQETEAWGFLQENDPWLELEILEFMDQIDLKRKRQRRRMAKQQVYIELNEAMDCLQHIYEEGCVEVGPMDRAPAKCPCEHFEKCRGIQLLIRHFASCHKQSCIRCRRMWQLLRLHSALCDRSATCKVPLCMQYKVKEEQVQGRLESGKWGLLVKKMKVVKVMSLLVKKIEQKAKDSVQ